MKTDVATTLLDEVMPAFDFRSRHERHVDAPPEWVAQAIEIYRMGPTASLLFRIRGIRLPDGTLRDVLTSSGFTVLAEQPGTEIVAGVNGKFWACDELANMESPADLDAFRSFDRPGWAQGAVSLRIEPRADGTSVLSTETRVRCVDADAKRRFAAYWVLIKPFGGWLRREFLMRVARIAEATE